MADHTKIEWADRTFNPWEGCQHAGPGCAGCYAEVRNARFGGGTAINWGPGAPRRRTSDANWKKPLKWQSEAEAFFAQHGRRQRIFCASLADVFDNAVDPEWRQDLFELIRLTPDLDWLLLTKRIGNVPNMLPVPFDFGEHYPNVWLGATVVNQDEADRDVPKLRAAKIALGVRIAYLSIEPMLGPIILDLDGIDLVICGGMSGNVIDAPLHPDWPRSLRDQCATAGTAFHFKQWGEWAPPECRGKVADEVLGDMRWVHTFPDGMRVGRFGKKAAGRYLDGRTHDEFPA